MTDELAGWIGPGGLYEGDLVFKGRVMIEGEIRGNIACEGFAEVSRTGRVVGRLEAVQALVAGEILGSLTTHERCTLMPTARVTGKLKTRWLDARLGCQIAASLAVEP